MGASTVTTTKRSRRSPARDAVLLLAALAVVAGGVWGLLGPGDSHADAAAGARTTEVEDGVLRVDGLADKTLAHVMPGMDMPDDVPAGMRRFALNVTLAATGDEPLAYTQRDFLVSGPGVRPVVPVRGDFDSGSVTAGSALSGSLTFDVPEESTTLRLQFQDGALVGLPRLPEVPSSGHATPAAPGQRPGGGHEHGAGQERGDGHAHGHAGSGGHAHEHAGSGGHAH